MTAVASPMRRHRPSGEAPPGALAILGAGALGIAVGIGVLEGIVAYRAFYLLGIFPGLLFGLVSPALGEALLEYSRLEAGARSAADG